jgi:hypothetical protein
MSSNHIQGVYCVLDGKTIEPVDRIAPLDADPLRKPAGYNAGD